MILSHSTVAVYTSTIPLVVRNGVPTVLIYLSDPHMFLIVVGDGGSQYSQPHHGHITHARSVLVTSYVSVHVQLSGTHPESSHAYSHHAVPEALQLRLLVSCHVYHVGHDLVLPLSISHGVQTVSNSHAEASQLDQSHHAEPEALQLRD